MSNQRPNSPTFLPVRACIFDVDGLLINSEDVYTDIYNNILRSYGKPDLPWSVKAKQQSRGREVSNYLPVPLLLSFIDYFCPVLLHSIIPY